MACKHCLNQWHARYKYLNPLMNAIQGFSLSKETFNFEIIHIRKIGDACFSNWVREYILMHHCAQLDVIPSYRVVKIELFALHFDRSLYKETCLAYLWGTS